MTSIKTRSEAEKLVLDHKKIGYDFIKVYDYLSYDNYKDILEFANKNQIPVYGHVPKSIDIKQAITLGQKSMEHITGFLDYDKVELLVPESDIPAIAKLMKEKQYRRSNNLVRSVSYRIYNNLFMNDAYSQIQPYDYWIQ